MMGKKYRKVRNALVCCLVAMLAVGCTDDADFVAPAFLHVDAIDLLSPAYCQTSDGNLEIITDTGFTTSNIVAAYVLAYFKDSKKHDSVGLFRLPFTVPILPSGELEYLRIYPAIPQSGQMVFLPYYTYYNYITIDDTTLVSGDTLNLGRLSTTYDKMSDFPLLFESFEPIGRTLKLDTVEWVRNDPAGARCGSGYGRVHLTPDQESYDFEVNMGHQFSGLDFYVNTSKKIPLLYLELDIKSQLELQVNMQAPYREGGNPSTVEVMRIYPTGDKWVHMYVNLGRTWSWFNHSNIFSITFSALNLQGIDGELLIDNVKLQTTQKTI